MIRRVLNAASRRYPFGIDDFFQQVVGSVLLTSPFLFTEETWVVAANISVLQASLMVLMTCMLGYGVLYVASREGQWDVERKIFGLTLRYVSLLAVSIGSIILLLGLTSAHESFASSILDVFKAISLYSIFSVIGAATADNLI